jgi:hypothetical protein
VECIAALYRHLGPNSKARNQLPQLLTAARTPFALAVFAQLMTDDPPNDAMAAAAMFAPLFQHRDYDPSAVFPQLLDGLQHASTAGSILDFANFLTRESLVSQHPAVDRTDELMTLLGGLVGQLGSLESSVAAPDDSPDLLSQQVNEGVTLATSICDALALIGDKRAVGKLYQASELGHRRLRVEAAYALAKLGEKAGGETLVGLAAESVVRLRVLAYADELDLLDEVDPQFSTGEAKAEAELALWLSQPSQFGVSPTECSLVDSRELYWPGFDDPVDCYLFRFAYRFGDREFSNVGIAAPVTHAFAADLCDLSPEDIYAAFAGWHAEHEDIYELDVTSLDEAQRVEVARLGRRLQDEGYEAIQPILLGSFFGERTLVARAMREGKPGFAVMDSMESQWVPQRVSPRPLGPNEAYCIYKGRRLLRVFNPD